MPTMKTLEIPWSPDLSVDPMTVTPIPFVMGQVVRFDFKYHGPGPTPDPGVVEGWVSVKAPQGDLIYHFLNDRFVVEDDPTSPRYNDFHLDLSAIETQLEPGVYCIEARDTSAGSENVLARRRFEIKPSPMFSNAITPPTVVIGWQVGGTGANLLNAGTGLLYKTGNGSAGAVICGVGTGLHVVNVGGVYTLSATGTAPTWDDVTDKPDNIINLDTILVGLANTDASLIDADAALAALIAGKAPLSHTHPASAIVSGVLDTARLGSGTADATTFLRGDGTWQPVVSGGITPYLGQVATGCHFPGYLAAPAQEWNSRSYHYARDDVASLQVRFANFYGIGEYAPGGVATFEASVEYPVGVFIRVKWGGVNTDTVANGAAGLLSDPCVVSIPKGAGFFIRCFATGAAGVPYHVRGPSTPFSGAEYGATGTLTNKVMSGTIAAGDGNIIPPVAIVATTTRVSFGIFGDSIMDGTGDILDDLTEERGLRRPIASHFAYIGSTMGGITIGDLLGASAKRRAIIGSYCSHIIQQTGFNDLGTSGTASAVLSSLASFLMLPGISGKKVFQATITPRSTSTDGWATETNQTTINNVERLKFNRQVLAGFPGLEGYIDFNRVVEGERDSGKLRVDFGVPTSDGVHPGNVIYRAVQTGATSDTHEWNGIIIAQTRGGVSGGSLTIGTTTITGGTAGRVLFVGADGKLDDDPGLVYNPTTGALYATEIRQDPMLTLTGGGTTHIQMGYNSFIILSPANGTPNFRLENTGLALGVPLMFSDNPYVGIGTNDVVVLRDASDTLAMRRGANPQRFNLYNSYTDASNNEPGFVRWVGNVFEVGTAKLGTGTVRSFAVNVGGNQLARWDANGDAVFKNQFGGVWMRHDSGGGVVIFGDIRPATVVVTSYVYSPVVTTGNGTLLSVPDGLATTTITVGAAYPNNIGSVHIHHDTAFGDGTTGLFLHNENQGFWVRLFAYTGGGLAAINSDNQPAPFITGKIISVNNSSYLVSTNYRWTFKGSDDGTLFDFVFDPPGSSTKNSVIYVYNMFADGSNYERGEIGWVGNALTIRASWAGTGAARNINFLVGDGTANGEFHFKRGDGLDYFYIDYANVYSKNYCDFNNSFFNLGRQESGLTFDPTYTIKWSAIPFAHYMGWDVGLARASAGVVKVTNGGSGGGALALQEIADPAAPSADIGVLFLRDNGSGKSQLCIRFPTGAVQVISTEP